MKMCKVCNQQYGRETIVNDYLFPIVKASELSLNDEFLQYQPVTERQTEFKRELIKAINGGVRDFRHSKIDFSKCKCRSLRVQKWQKPAVGYTAEWWKEKAKKICPEKNSRLGNQYQYYAFLGTILKYLVEKEGWTKIEAWNAVCDDSSKLGYYSQDFGPTGIRKVGMWYDLANTCKLLKSPGQFLLASGCYCNNPIEKTLSEVIPLLNDKDELTEAVGWIVLDV